MGMNQQSVSLEDGKMDCQHALKVNDMEETKYLNKSLVTQYWFEKKSSYYKLNE